MSKLHVTSVCRDGVWIERRADKHQKLVSWDTLHDAATQDDPELREEYARALREAERLASTVAPLTVCYGQDSTNVWWTTWVETWGGLRVGRTWRTMTIVAADEGMTQAQEWMARDEAYAIAARIGKIPGADVTVRRVPS